MWGHVSLACLCAGLAINANAQQTPRPPMETRVAWSSRCPSEPVVRPASDNRFALAAGLIAAIGPKLISGAVDSAAEALKAAGDPHTSTSTARTAHDFYKVSVDADYAASATCLVVARGVFDPAAAAPVAWAKDIEDLKTLVKPAFQMEAKVTPLRGGKFFLLTPIYLKVSDFEEFSFFDPKDRDYVIAVSMSLPGAEQPFGHAEFSFNGLERGVELKQGDNRLRRAASLPIAFPAPTADAEKAKAALEAQLAPYLKAIDILTPPKSPPATPPSLQDGTDVASKSAAFCSALKALNADTPRAYKSNDARCAYTLEGPSQALDASLAAAHRSPPRTAWARQICDLQPGDEKTNIPPRCKKQDDNEVLTSLQQALAFKSFTYVTTQLTMAETRDGSKIAKALGNALSASKDDVSKVLSDQLVPKTPKQKAEDEEANRQARNTVLASDLEVAKAEEALSEALQAQPVKASDVTAARIALLKAKIESNKARRAAGQPVLYSEVE